MADYTIALRPMAVGELLNYNFFIPSYQRGYRWRILQVKDLLDDIEEFCEKGAKGIYCIQPLVVKHNSSKWEVIDGQQRLTTISIILSCLRETKFTLQYETRKKSQSFIDNIMEETEQASRDNIDYYHMVMARNFILQWMDDKDDNFIKLFKETLLKKVKFIWYNTDTQDPITVFTRLNIDRIPLTSAELIKALFLNRSNFAQEGNYERVRLFQQELASQWDKMESTLQNDEFWLFFHDDGQTPETRIDYIFELICNQGLLGESSDDIGTDHSRVFRYFYDFFHRNKYNNQTLQFVWEKVKNIYDTLYEWYSHNELYHYVGYLMARPKESTRLKGNYSGQQSLLHQFHQKWCEPGMTIGLFKQYLIEQINNTLSECNDLSKIYETKGHPKTQCRPLLLLHNVETIVQQGRLIKSEYKQAVFNRFPFNLYKKERWDVEHIDSNTTNELTDFDSQKEWLLTTYVIASDEQKKEIEKFCEQMQDKDDNERKPIFNHLVKNILPTINEDEVLSDEEKNMIWNFTLLDEATNRGYRNAIFPAKRRIIIGKEQGVFHPVPTFNKEKGFSQPLERSATSAFIPLCTKQTFMKYYSPTSGSMVAWTKPDAEAYRYNIYRILSKSFNVRL